MRKLIFIISFLLAIQYGGSVYADTNETIEEQEETLGISDFIEESKKYTKDTFSDIDIDNIYEGAIAGDVKTSGIVKVIFGLAGKEVLGTIKVLGYILVIIVVHSIIKSISEGMGRWRSWRDNILCSIYFDSDSNYD